jgi:hypothetical protein
MMQHNTKRILMKWVETIFDFTYLFTVLIAALLLYKTAETGSLRWQYALMCFVLVAGDTFHLIPRIYALVDRKDYDHTVSLGIGKFITSITMTLFYLILWEINIRYYDFNGDRYLSFLVYGSATLRILLCVFPQNRWMDKNPPQKWAIIRNIPFFILGMAVMIFNMTEVFKNGGSLSFLWLAILISFACYLPVVLFSRTNPKVGMLMLPKSCAYIAIVLMGFSLT